MTKRAGIAVVCVLVMLAVAGIAVLGLDWQLRHAPLPVDFLDARIEAAINQTIAPMRAKIAAAELRYDAANDNQLGVSLSHVALTAPDGTPIAEIENASVDLDWPSLLTTSVVPTGVTLIAPQLRLRYAKDKGLRLESDRSSVDTGAASNAPAATAAAAATSAVPPAIAAPADMASTRSGAPLDVSGLLRGLLTNHGAAGGGLNTLHIRDASVTIGEPGHAAVWRIPKFDFDIKHQAEGDILVGAGTARAPGGPFHATLTVEQPSAGSDYKVSLSVDHMVPADLAELSPALLPLAPALLPVGGDATLAIGADGSLSRLDMNVGLGKGQYNIGGACAESFRLDNGGLHIRYVRGTGKVEVLPSAFASNGSSATISGLALVAKDAAGRDRWQYNLEFSDVRLADPAHGLQPMPVDTWNARGTFTPSTGETVLDRLALQAGEARLAMAGRISEAGLQLEARAQSAGPQIALRLWPACFQSYARNWMLAHVQSGKITSGHMRIALDADELQKLRSSGRVPDEAANAEFSVEDIAFTYADGLPPVLATRGDMQFAGRRFTASLPDAASQMPSGRVLTLTNARYEVADFLDPAPRGLISLEAAGPIETGLEFLNAKPLGLVTASGLRFTDFSGEFSGHVDLELPVLHPPQPGELSVKASAALKSLKLKHLVGGYALQGGTVDLEATESSLRAEGDLLVNGVAAKLLWSRPIGAGSGPLPPLRITATLDANDREQLGLLVNHMLAGDVPVTVDLAAGPQEGSDPYAHVEADLTSAELVLEALAWHKPEGEAATVAFDAAPGDRGRTRLQNFRLTGDKVAIGGEVELGADHRMTAFYFPSFSINVVTQLDLSGHVRPDKILEVQARGRFFDGRDFFRSLFSIGQLTAKPLPPPKATAGLDITADIDTVLGYSQVSLHGVHVHAVREQGQLSALGATGTLDGGRKVTVGLERLPQARFLEISSEDAGQMFRLINLYQGLEGGQAALKVNLDSQGTAEKSGTLWAKQFTLMGDPIVKEVLHDAAPPGGPTKKNSDRPQFDFDRMRVQFSVGEGQLVLRDMFINGPVLGATLRGRVDYAHQSVQLGGTYIPLYGINSMFGAVPILGQLLVGRSGEGLLGITFAVQGPLARPDVIVNPVSVVAPGIFRQIFEIGPVQAGADAASAAPNMNSFPDTGPDIGDAFPPMSPGQ